MNKQKHRLRKLNEREHTAICETCGPVKVYYKKGRKRWYCSVSRKKWLKPRFEHLKSKFCEICEATKDLCGDHDHVTDSFRGTLCRTCNLGLGLFKDNVDFSAPWNMRALAILLLEFEKYLQACEAERMDK